MTEALIALNEEYFTFRPANAQDRGLEGGIWFWPSADYSALTKACTLAADLTVDDYAVDGTRFSVMLIRPRDKDLESPHVDQKVKVVFDPTTSGTWDLSISVIDGDQQVVSLRSGPVDTVFELTDALEEVLPLAAGLV